MDAPGRLYAGQPDRAAAEVLESDHLDTARNGMIEGLPT